MILVELSILPKYRDFCTGLYHCRLGSQRQERLCKEEIKFNFFELSEVEQCPSPQERSRAFSQTGELGTFYRRTSALQGLASTRLDHRCLHKA
jgi:hypothetical protein